MPIVRCIRNAPLKCMALLIMLQAAVYGDGVKQFFDVKAGEAEVTLQEVAL